MPQTFQVLRCYKCEVFQVHPIKKTNKWNCKLCGEKQSMKRFYGLGTGKECRLHVQKLNGIRGELDSTQCTINVSDLSSVSENSGHSEQDEVPPCSIAKKSKWLNYVDPRNDQKQQNLKEPMYLNNTEVVLALPEKCKGKRLINKTSRIRSEPNIESLPDNSLMPTNLNESNEDLIANSLESSKKVVTNDCISKPLNNVIFNKLVTPTIVNNSKWAQYVEEAQICNDENNIVHNLAAPMFPFLVDEDLDSALDL